jgi:integrase
MKSDATARNVANSIVTNSHHSSAQYGKVFDQRKRRIRGLWERNGAFYAQLTVTDEETGKKTVRRIRLEDGDCNPVGTISEAVKVMNKLKVRREENELNLAPKRTAHFADYSQQYLEYCVSLENKTKNTIHRERTSVNALAKILGELRLREITKAVAMRYMAARKRDGMSSRSINLEIVTLRNVLRHAVAEGHLKTLAIDGIEWLHDQPKKRRLVTAEEIEAVCNAAVIGCPMTGQIVSDFIKLMAYSGGRWAETLRLQWADVDFQNNQLTIGSDGRTKNRKARAVDFNPKLKAHLEEMSQRRAPDSTFIFPSPRRGDGDAHTVTMNKALRKARESAKVPDFTCHLCRHFFISICVMSGIDFMTIAKWVGHQDGGVLIGKVYGHLSNEHTKRQAQRVNFGPTVAAAAA